MFMVVSGMLIVIIFMALFSSIYQDNLKSKKVIVFEDFGYSLQNELLIASQVHTGYRRTFLVPAKLDGFDYNISISHAMLLVDYSDNVFALPIPNVTGSFIKGTNVILNQDNKLFLN
jgi:hypothetical protein